MRPQPQPYDTPDQNPSVPTQMKQDAARQIGEELKDALARLRVLAKEERDARGPDADAIEIAVVNLDSAIDILTE